MKKPIKNKYQTLLIYAFSLNPIESIENEIFDLSKQTSNSIEVLKDIQKEIKILESVLSDLQQIN